MNKLTREQEIEKAYEQFEAEKIAEKEAVWQKAEKELAHRLPQHVDED